MDELKVRDDLANIYTSPERQGPFVAMCDELAKGAGSLIPAVYKNGAAVMAAMLTGRELGFGPMQSLRMLFPINGVVGIYSQAMEALLERAGIRRDIVEWTPTRCAIKFTRGDRTAEFDYTMDEAVQSGDAKKNPSYEKRPKDMLYARCMARGARKIAADILGGLYTEDERETIQVIPATVSMGSEVVGQATQAADIDAAFAALSKKAPGCDDGRVTL